MNTKSTEMPELRPNQKHDINTIAFRESKVRIVVEFWEGRDAGRVLSKILLPDGSSEGLYVVVFEERGRMLVGLAPGLAFEECNPESTYVNPCGADNIEDCGLDPEIFNTYYAGGLFEIVEGRPLESPTAKLTGPVAELTAQVVELLAHQGENV